MAQASFHRWGGEGSSDGRELASTCHFAFLTTLCPQKKGTFPGTCCGLRKGSDLSLSQ